MTILKVSMNGGRKKFIVWEGCDVKSLFRTSKTTTQVTLDSLN